VRLGNWLTADEARRFWQTPDPATLKCKRDRAILAVLLGCGLRRRELADLDFTHLQQREEHWAIVDLVGKGGYIRTVPMPDWVKTTLDEWIRAAELHSGKSSGVYAELETVRQRRHRARGLARGQVVRRESWLCWSGSSRLATLVREALPFGRKRVGTDSIPARPCFGPNYRVLSRLQTTNSWVCKRPDRYRTVARPEMNRHAD